MYPRNPIRTTAQLSRLVNKAACEGVLRRLFGTRSVMRRLREDHSKDLGYSLIFFKGQDAGFDSGSSSE